MKFLRLSLRDFFWLTLLAAVAFGWYVNRRQTAAAVGVDSQTRIASFLLRARSRGLFVVESDLRDLELMRLATLSDAELRDSFQEEIPEVDDRGMNARTDLWLTEFVRRKYPQPLREEFARLSRHPSYHLHGGPGWKIAVLTALRRAEGKPDPLQITFDIQRDNPRRIARIALRFVDENGQEIKDLRPYEEYQEGRDQRWRLELLDAVGEPIVNDANLPPSASWFSRRSPEDDGIRLDPRKYLAPPKSGRYRLRLVFCRHPIAKYPRTDGFLTWESQPIEVTVQRGFRLPQMYLAAMVAVTLGLLLLISVCRLPIRDTVFLALVTTVACGWTIDQYGLALRIYEEVPHYQADWTMRKSGDA